MIGERYDVPGRFGPVEFAVIVASIVIAFMAGWWARENRIQPRLLLVEGLDPRADILVRVPPDSSFTLRWDGYELRRVR